MEIMGEKTNIILLLNLILRKYSVLFK